MTDWAAGDWAFCLRRKPWIRCDDNWQPICESSEGPQWGSVHQVTKVYQPFLVAVLSFGAYPGRVYDSRCFRKVTPGHDITGIEERRIITRPADADRVFIGGA